jgi:soluble lytic murein transglycosylase-like protein
MTRLAVFVLALTALPLCAAEIAVLQTGYRLRAQKIEREGGKYVLATEQGRIELDEAQVASIESEPEPAKAASESVPAPASPAKANRSPKQLIDEAAALHGIPKELVHGVAQVESAYRVDAVSPKGAMGVMQLMPATARTLNADPRDPAQNIEAGTRLLRELLEKYANDPNPVRRALAAYNAGEGAVQRYGGVPPYRETQMYVEKVIERYWKQVDPSVIKGAAAPSTRPATAPPQTPAGRRSD